MRSSLLTTYALSSTSRHVWVERAGWDLAVREEQRRIVAAVQTEGSACLQLRLPSRAAPLPAACSATAG